MRSSTQPHSLGRDADAAPEGRSGLTTFLTRGRVARWVTLAVALIIWFVPPPEALGVQAWRLFAIFAATILAVVIGAFPILTASVLGLASAILTGVLPTKVAYSSFANPTIVLIIVAFLLARSVVKCGLGQRLGFRAISLFGRSTLGLSYAIYVVDAVIAPAFPSNTARSGVLYPLVLSMAEAAGVSPDFIRLSIGLEDIEDILWDLEQALN